MLGVVTNLGQETDHDEKMAIKSEEQPGSNWSWKST